MPTLLQVDSSPMGDASMSRRLTQAYVRSWQRAHPGGRVRCRDLARTAMPVVDAAWVAANFTPKALRSPQQEALLALSTTLTTELLDADEYVLGIPMHNWGPSASFKLWVDQIVRQEETLKATPQGPTGALAGKRATFIIAAGASYRPDLPAASGDFIEPWLRRLFAYLGIEDMRFVMADRVVGVIRGEVDPDTFLAPHLETVRALFEPAEEPLPGRDR
ncbi:MULTISPECIES: NAD(P)H-dependent oxidoreductase [unclassified Burkholderia]|uniref:FMN-dependent NADH-azoreductase n=1 Tax=unclassified Burkholderia TaxID=2613784 RepID=UPI00141DE81A|nr:MULTISPECIES: NAD(P)H-dependent oxidoreductase [unclassified Burkholderia]NIF71772.1 FMN-dependent NADH-azoreductase [Burkholderia sp. Ap-962]NIF89016.1 FMN-dependent NADH-azoreductase [Burkholderia sp. Cy-637]